MNNFNELPCPMQETSLTFMNSVPPNAYCLPFQQYNSHQLPRSLNSNYSLFEHQGFVAEPVRVETPFQKQDDYQPFKYELPELDLDGSDTSTAYDSNSNRMVPISSTSPGDRSAVGGVLIPDNKLVEMSVKQLNVVLQGADAKRVHDLKLKRRTLKNRGYAYNCRVKRMQSQVKLEADNHAIMAENRALWNRVQELEKLLQRQH